MLLFWGFVFIYCSGGPMRNLGLFVVVSFGAGVCRFAWQVLVLGLGFGVWVSGLLGFSGFVFLLSWSWSL